MGEVGGLGYVRFEDAIADQPRVLADAARLARAITPGARAAVRGSARPVLAGMGASHSVLAAPVYALRQRGVAAQRVAGELPPRASGPGDLCLAVSNSGRSPETVDVVLRFPRDHRVSVVNRGGSPLAAACQEVIYLGNLPDSRMSSLAATATLMVLGMLADLWTDDDLDPSWLTLPAAIASVLQASSGLMTEAAGRFAEARAFDFVGAGPAVSAAESGALLVREGFRLPAAAMETRTYLHGPADSAPGSAVILIGGDREAELAAQLRRAGVAVLLIGPSAHGAGSFRIEARSPCRDAVIQTVLVQALIAALARQRSVELGASPPARLDTKLPPGPEAAATAAT